MSKLSTFMRKHGDEVALGVDLLATVFHFLPIAPVEKAKVYAGVDALKQSAENIKAAADDYNEATGILGEIDFEKLASETAAKIDVDALVKAAVERAMEELLPTLITAATKAALEALPEGPEPPEDEEPAKPSKKSGAKPA